MQGGAGGGAGGGMRRQQLDLTPLALSEEQKSKVEAMRQQTRNKLRELKKGMMEKQMQMRNLMFNPEASETQIRSARKEVRALQDQVDESNLNDLLSIRAMLTPEQRKKLPECAPGRNNQMGGGRSRQFGNADQPGGWSPPGNRPGMGLQNGAQITSDGDFASKANRKEMRREMKQRFSTQPGAVSKEQ